jgi:endonuclease YncB( thermonuclease family)
MFSTAGMLSTRPSDAAGISAAAFALGIFVGASAFGALLAVPHGADTAAAPSLETTASAVATPTPIFARGIYPAEVLRVADGDSFEARVLVWPGIAITTMVRLRGVDTPELRARCPEERTKAEAARAKLASILAEGTVELRAVGLDKYGGRIDASASTRATPDVSAAILQAGLGRSYTGGRRESWCAAG